MPVAIPYDQIKQLKDSILDFIFDQMITSWFYGIELHWISTFSIHFVGQIHSIFIGKEAHFKPSSRILVCL